MGIPVSTVCSVQVAWIESSQTQVSSQGLTFSITHGSFFMTAGGEVSGVGSGDNNNNNNNNGVLVVAAAFLQDGSDMLLSSHLAMTQCDLHAAQLYK